MNNKCATERGCIRERKYRNRLFWNPLTHIHAGNKTNNNSCEKKKTVKQNSASIYEIIKDTVC